MNWLSAAVFAVAGIIVGILYFALLYRSVRLYASSAGLARVAPLHLLRGALAVSFFWIVAQQGAVPLLAALAGFLIARTVVQRRLAVG